MEGAERAAGRGQRLFLSAGGLPGCIRAAQRGAQRCRQDGGRGARGRKGHRGWARGRQAGGKQAGLEPQSPGPDPPRPAGGPLSTVESPSVLSPCSNGSSRKWLNPMYFYTQHTPGRRAGSDHSLSLCMLWWGQDEVYVGEGVKHKERGPSSSRDGSSPRQYRQKSLGSISHKVQSYWKTP